MVLWKANEDDVLELYNLKATNTHKSHLECVNNYSTTFVVKKKADEERKTNNLYYPIKCLS